MQFCSLQSSVGTIRGLFKTCYIRKVLSVTPQKTAHCSVMVKDLEDEETDAENWVMEKFKLCSGSPNNSEDVPQKPGEKHGYFRVFFRTSLCGLRSCLAQTWFLILFLCLGYFRPRGRKIDSTKEATIEDADSESLKWFLSGVFNPILLWFNKLHLNHIWDVPSTARRVYTPIKLQTFAEAFWVLIRFRKMWGNIVPEILGGLEYFGRYGPTVCHVSSSAHVQKGLEIEKFVLKPNTKERRVSGVT